MDKASWHTTKQLQIPENIIIGFLPPYSPELNPAEKMWQKFKRAFTNKLFKTIEELENFIAKQTQEINKNQVISTCAYSYIFLNNYWSNIQFIFVLL